MSVTSVEVSSADFEKPEATQETPAVVTETPKAEAQVSTETPAVTTPKAEAPVAETQTPAVEANVDLDGAAEEFLTKGEITEATLKALEAKGFKADQVKVYAAGIQAQADAATSKLAERVGGKETLTQMLQWAKQGGLAEADRTAYDSMMTSGNEAQMAFAVDGLAARYERALGSAPSRVNGQSAPVAGVKPFASNAEVVVAMRDPRYKNDEAYRASVARRLAESNVL